MNKHLYHVIMQIVITAPRINNPLRTQGHSEFGSCLWLEQADSSISCDSLLL